MCAFSIWLMGRENRPWPKGLNDSLCERMDETFQIRPKKVRFDILEVVYINKFREYRLHYRLFTSNEWRFSKFYRMDILR